MAALAFLPQPGGPQKIIEGTRSLSRERRRRDPSRSSFSCPQTSSRERGRMRSASGCCARGSFLAGNDRKWGDRGRHSDFSRPKATTRPAAGNRGDSKRPCPAKETLIAGELAQDGASRHYLAPMRRKRINRKIKTAFLAFERSFQRWINFVIKHEGISQPLKKQRVRLALGRPARTILQ